MPGKLVDVLLAHVDGVFAGPNGDYPAVLESLEGVTAERAAWKPGPRANSIWQIVDHLSGSNVWEMEMLVKFQADPPAWTEPAGGEAAWQDSLAKLHQTQADLRAALAALTDERLLAIPVAEWDATRDTLQLYTQVVGKVRLANEPITNHWWNVPLYVSARGLTTSLMPHPSGPAFQIDFDLVDHRLDTTTVAGDRRMIGDVLLETELDCGRPRTIAGFENHAGRTRLDPGAEPLGRVVAGFGNDGESGYEGCRLGRAIGTYLHGPLLPRNPWLADWLLAQALAHRTGGDPPDLPPLPDDLENRAHAVSAGRARERGGRA
jgi:hypothetical protein